MTNVAIAFPRNPIHLAHQANDHQLLSSGRFILGLGTQVRAQIEKRFGAEFDKPVARMTELIAALRAIFAAWNSGERLDFRGDYYRHTLMTPTFNPGPNPHGPPPIYVGALGPLLTRAVAQHADGLLVMPFGSKRFLHEHTMPMVHEGLAGIGPSARTTSPCCPRSSSRPATPTPNSKQRMRGRARYWPSTGRRRRIGRCWPHTAGRTCNPN